MLYQQIYRKKWDADQPWFFGYPRPEMRHFSAEPLPNKITPPQFGPEATLLLIRTAHNQNKLRQMSAKQVIPFPGQTDTAYKHPAAFPHGEPGAPDITLEELGPMLVPEAKAARVLAPILSPLAKKLAKLRFPWGKATEEVGAEAAQRLSGLDRTIQKMEEKGFTPTGPDPFNGEGAYLHPKSGRGYRPDRFGQGQYPLEPDHFDVHYKQPHRDYRKALGKPTKRRWFTD